MNYRKVYLKIIQNAKKQNRKKGEIYYESHHILPKSLFPLWKNRKSNLVLLTAREHFFCHQLLTKIYPMNQMFNALWRMTISSSYNITSYQYERLKIQYSSFRSKYYVGSKNSFFNKHHTEDLKNKFKEKGKKIICLETNEVFVSIRDCCRKLNLKNMRRHFSNVLKGKLGNIKGFHFQYLNEFENNEKAKCIIFEEQSEILKHQRKEKKKIICLETNEVFNSIWDASLKLFGTPNKRSLIVNVLKERSKTAAGYHWKYL